MNKTKKLSQLYYRQKERLFKGKQYFEVTDSTVKSNISGLTTGKIKGKFKTKRFGDTISFTQVATTRKFVGVQIGQSFFDDAFAFQYFNDGVVELRMYVDLPRFTFVDSKLHTYEIIVDGINNRIVIDNVTYDSLNGLKFTNGSKTTAAFMLPAITDISLGIFKEYINPNYVFGGQVEGLIPTIEITDLSDNPYYSFESDGDNFSASHTTVYRKNDILNLPLNNSFTDISDNPKTITENGTITWEDGVFGELNSAAVFDNNDYLSFVNNENLEKYSVMGWIKHNENIDSNIASYLLANDIYTNYTPGSLAVLINYINSNVRLTIVLFSTSIVDIERYIFDLGLQPFKYHHIAVTFDSINKIVDVWVNGKYVNKSLNISTSSDLSKVQPLPSATYFVGGQSNNISVLTDCSIYDVSIYKYLLTAEEIKEEFKRLPIPYIFNGNNYVDVDLSAGLGTALSGLSNCYIEGTFKQSKTDKTVTVFSTTDNSVIGSSFKGTRIHLNLDGYGFNFRTNEGSSLLYVQSGLIGEWTDGKVHTFSLYLNGSSSTLEIDGVTQSVTILSSIAGFNDNVTDFAIGNHLLYTDSSYSTSRYFDGSIFKLFFKNSSKTTTYFSFENTNGAKIISSENYEVK